MRKFFLAMVVASGVAGSACSAQKPVPANFVVADPRCTRDAADVSPFIRSRREDKHAAELATLTRALADTKPDVLFLGDSILQRWPDAVLDRAFPGQKVLNLGVGGERVADMLYRLQVATGARNPAGENPGIANFARQSPRTVVVLIGTNDLRLHSSCYIADGTVQIAAALRTLYPKARIVFAGILPRGNPQGQFAPQIAEANAMVAATARKTHAFETVDISPTFACKPQQTCDVALPRNYVHPSDKGYALLTTALRDYLARSR